VSRTAETPPSDRLLPGEMARPAFPPPRGRRDEEIVAAFRRILEAEGLEAPSMRRVADELGIKAPSLYKHFSSRADIETELVADAMAELGDATHRAIHDAGDSGALMSLLMTYRDSCFANPALYLLATQGSFNRERIPPGLEEWAGNPFFVVTGDAALAQALWSFAHGMVVLEMNDRFPPGSNLDDTWFAGGMAFEKMVAWRSS
jgi:AcrR family transcriptional regulator